MRIVRPTMLACAIAALSAGIAQAQEIEADTSPHGVVAIGAGVVPEFDGSKDVRVLPAMLADIRWRGVNFQAGGRGWPETCTRFLASPHL